MGWFISVVSECLTKDRQLNYCDRWSKFDWRSWRQQCHQCLLKVNVQKGRGIPQNPVVFFGISCFFCICIRLLSFMSLLERLMTILRTWRCCNNNGTDPLLEDLSKSPGLVTDNFKIKEQYFVKFTIQILISEALSVSPGSFMTTDFFWYLWIADIQVKEQITYVDSILYQNQNSGSIGLGAQKFLVSFISSMSSSNGGNY